MITQIMKTLYSFLFILFGYSALAQIEFGPYLTYSGHEDTSNPENPIDETNQMTVHIALNPIDTKDYYVVYWSETKSTAYAEKMDVERIINTTACEKAMIDGYPNTQMGIANVKYKIKSKTLTGLSSNRKHFYFITDGDYFPVGYKTRTNKIVDDNAFDKAFGKPIVVDVNKIIIDGEIDGTENHLVVTGNKAYFNNFSIAEGSTLEFSHTPNKIYSFTTPNNNADEVSFSIISDTQPRWYMDESPDYSYYNNLTQAVKDGTIGSFLMHGGDFGGMIPVGIKQIDSFPDLFANIPFQITEGNHDTGYYVQHGNLVEQDSDIDTSSYIKDDGSGQQVIFNTTYTREMIWFDKLFHYDYPTLAEDTNSLYNHNYSFDWGPVHVSVMDYDNHSHRYNTKPLQICEDQLNWLRNDLESTSKKWKIILLHHPTSNLNLSVDGGAYSGKAHTILYDLMEDYEVQLIIYGHTHVDGENHEEIFDTNFSGSSKRYVHMRVPMNASSSKPIDKQYSYYTIKIWKEEEKDENGNVTKEDNYLKIERINKDNELVDSDTQIFQLDSSCTIKLK